MHLRAIVNMPALIVGLALAACTPTQILDDRPEAPDVDGDGYSVLVDCNDDDDAIHPGAEESCDEVDNDCDGLIDELGAIDATVWYVDGDEDGFGDPDVTREACTQPDFYVDNADDCDDAQSTVYPSADEICDGLDNDCNDEVDESTALDAKLYYWDFDEDGYGNPDRPERSCVAESWLVTNSDDCDDSRGDISPDATEVCDTFDNDCDGAIDDADPSVDASTFSLWYTDADGDGFGTNPTEFVEACDAGVGYALNFDDCNDEDAELTTDCDT